jgi:hypothetical protein
MMNSVLSFGKKHPGKTIAWIIENDPGYLCWLREIRLQENGQMDFLSRDVNDALDAAIEAGACDKKTGKALKKRHALWRDVRKKEADATASQTKAKTAEPPLQREAIYGDRWGTWA